MNFGGGGSKPKVSTVRKTVVRVPATQSVNPNSLKPPVRQHDPNRFKPTGTPALKSKKPQNPAKRAVSNARGVKRKSATPQPAWSSDSEDGSSDIGGSDSDASRKRIKSSVSSIDSHGPRRSLVCEEAFKTEIEFQIIHGASATSGEHTPKFKNPWGEEDFETCKLQYPSKGQKERFQLKWPKNETDDYKPMEDIIETVDTICRYYFPEDLSQKHTSEETGYRRQYNRAWQRESVEEFIQITNDFNAVCKKLVDDGTIRQNLRSESGMSLDWVRRILDQTYSRTVSPKVETLRAYKNGSDNVYGELLPRFVSDIFKKTRLNHEQVFIDLGSGVGNVNLQAALEVGCESWGIEMMRNPCDLAELQEKEFPERARLWGLSAGKVKLLRGDFTQNQEIGDVLKRADVVLVNNQAFTPQLNAQLLSIFLDLKDGSQVVSLKPFVPDGFKMSSRNVGDPVNMFVQRKFEYFSDSVSWGADYGNWYIATKDPRPLERFMRHM